MAYVVERSRIDACESGSDACSAANADESCLIRFSASNDEAKLDGLPGAGIEAEAGAFDR